MKEGLFIMNRHVFRKSMMAIAIGMMLFIAGCGDIKHSSLNPAGEVGKEQFNLMMLAIIIMLVVVAVVVVLFLIVMVKFRRSKLGDDFVPKDVEGNHKLEVIWTVIPIILLIILAVPTVYYTFKLADVNVMNDEKKSKEEYIINVTANQYWWEFEYPNEKIVTSQELVVPTDKKVYFNLKASDVKHSFWIPSAGGKMDTNVENINQFYLKFDSDKAKEANNIFYGKCAELCGSSHALMDFKVKAMSEEDFKQWADDMAKVQESKVADLSADAKEGQEIFKNSCMGCHATTPTGSGAQGPNLTNFGDRDHVAGILENNKENVAKWIKDPESVKPGNKMTGQYEISDEDADKVAEYLTSLKLEDLEKSEKKKEDDKKENESEDKKDSKEEK